VENYLELEDIEHCKSTNYLILWKVCNNILPTKDNLKKHEVYHRGGLYFLHAAKLCRELSLPSVDSLVIVKAIADVNPINWSRYGQLVDDIIKEDSISEIVLLEIIALSL
jgi:hypothetical protein